MVLTEVFIPHYLISRAKNAPVWDCLIFWNNGVFIEKHNRWMRLLLWIKWLPSPVYYSQSGAFFVHSVTLCFFVLLKPAQIFLRLGLSSTASSPTSLPSSVFALYLARGSLSESYSVSSGSKLIYAIVESDPPETLLPCGEGVETSSDSYKTVNAQIFKRNIHGKNSIDI